MAKEWHKSSPKAIVEETYTINGWIISSKHTGVMVWWVFAHDAQGRIVRREMFSSRRLADGFAARTPMPIGAVRA